MPSVSHFLVWDHDFSDLPVHFQTRKIWHSIPFLVIGVHDFLHSAAKYFSIQFSLFIGNHITNKSSDRNFLTKQNAILGIGLNWRVLARRKSWALLGSCRLTF